MSFNDDKLIALLSKVLDVDTQLITDDTAPDNTETWDSFNALVMVSELEVEFQVNFTMDEIYAVKCVNDITEALKSHDVSFSGEHPSGELLS